MTLALPGIAPTVERWATLSGCGLYRYDLGERWDPAGWLLGGCFLNPSAATAEVDDPTKVRWRERARQLGAGGWVIVNPFAFRATDPKGLLAAAGKSVDVVGPGNDDFILRWAKESRIFVCGWGAHARHHHLRPRIGAVVAMLEAASVELHALRRLDDGTPEHPLYLPYALRPMPWRPKET